MIDLKFTNGKIIKTGCKKPSSAINKAIQSSPVKGSIDGTKMIKNGKVFAIITGCSWELV